jgi:ADP-heptose:LPS heptosyltransferase
MTLDRTGFLKSLDATGGAALCRLLSHFVYTDNAAAEPALIDKSGIRRILVIRPGGLGDMIVLMPVLSLLKNTLNDAQIDVLCESRNSEALDLAAPGLGRVVYDTSPVKALRKLRRTAYDLAIDTEQFHNFSAVLAFWSGAGRRIGFKVNPRRNALYTDLIGYDQDAPEVDQFKDLLAPLGMDSQSLNQVGHLAGASPEPSPSLRNRLDDCLDSKPFAVFHVGGSTRHKQWPPIRFSELIAGVAGEFDLAAVLVGNSGDNAAAEEIAGTCGSKVPLCNFCGPMSFSDAAYIIKKARVYVGGDSGLAHAAAALDVPSVVLFGPSDENKWGTQGPRHTVVRVKLPCSPCSIFGYTKPCRHIQCMAGITAAQVMEQVRLVLREAETPQEAYYP